MLERLKQIQGKDLDTIKEELNHLRIYDYTKISNMCMKKILKKLDFNKYYEHTQYINNQLINLTQQL